MFGSEPIWFKVLWCIGPKVLGKLLLDVGFFFGWLRCSLRLGLAGARVGAEVDWYMCVSLRVWSCWSCVTCVFALCVLDVALAFLLRPLLAFFSVYGALDDDVA